LVCLDLETADTKPGGLLLLAQLQLGAASDLRVVC
jgi:hypothetical protein